MKLLLLDIETAPHLAYVWGLWQQNVGTNMLIEGGYVLSWAAKWYGEDEIFFASLQGGHASMVNKIHKLLNEADAVIHYNGTKFDMPHLSQEFVLKGLAPPAPYTHIDLLKTVRSQFKFPSNKLEYVVERLKVGVKGDSGGFKTWVGCMEGDAKSWAKLEKYNIQDILILEKLYDKLKPWIKNHPNASADTGTFCCPTCGSGAYQSRGTARTRVYTYRRFQCKSCSRWFRGNKSIKRGTGEVAVAAG